MIHTLNISRNLTYSPSLSHDDILKEAINTACQYYGVKFPEKSLEVQTSSALDTSSRQMSIFINVSYDTDKDTSVSKSLTSGRSIPVPSH